MIKTLTIAAAAVAVMASKPAAPIAQGHAPGLGPGGPGGPGGIVALDSGRVSGGRTGQGNAIAVYKGIPYAAPPVGDLRWRPPQPVAPWTGVRPATEFSAIPMQRNSPQPQSENCLTINVWSPAKAAADRLPVMFWIFGGGFTYGSSAARAYDGTRLAEHGVVVVSFNYRLNVFAGFAHPLLRAELTHGSGNYGLLDQIAALNWVQKNIAGFGGNPDNVTIVGESAGGLSVTALAVSPMTTGLFEKAIIESGSAGQLATQQAAEAAGTELVRAMGLDGDPNLLAKLRSKKWNEFPGAITYRGSPVLDGWAFPQHPRDAWAKGEQHDVPMIIGTNRDEETASVDQRPIPANVAAFQQSVRDRFGVDADRVLAMYPAKTSDEMYWAEIGIRTDQRFAMPARLQLRGTFSVSSKAWQYRFSYLPDGPRDSRLGVSHGAELTYVFGTIPANADKATRTASDAIMNYWTQFAKTGDPNQPGLPPWPAFAKDSESYLEIGRTIRADKDLNRDKLDLLQRYPPPPASPR